MRVALIILSILALIFIGSISWSLVNQEGWKVRVPNIANESSTSNTNNNPESIALETWKNQIKTDEKLEKLTTLVEELARKSGTYPTENAVSPSMSGMTNIDAPSVKPTGKLLALLMPTVTPVLEKNKGIFGLFIFDMNVKYATYKDEALALTIMPTDIGYDVMVKNIKALGGKPFILNETKSFPFRSFFLNPETTDTMVRLVIEIENQTIAMEIPKSKYDILKNLLLGKGTLPPVSSSKISQKKPAVTIVPTPKSTISVTPTRTNSGTTKTGTTR